MSEFRQSRWRRFLLVGAVGVFLVVAGIGYSVYRSKAEVSSRLQAIRDQGLPTNGAELNDFYRVPEAASDATASWKKVTDWAGGPGFAATVAPLPIFGQDAEVQLPGVEWPEFEASQSALAGPLQQGLETAHRAAAAGGSVRFPQDYRQGVATVLRDTQQLRSVAQLFRLDAYVAAHQQDYDRVLLNIRGILTTADTVAAEPTLISHLIRHAVRGLGIATLQELFPYTDWSDATLRELQEQLAAADIRGGMRQGFVGERAIAVQEIKTLAGGVFETTNLRTTLDYFDQALAALELPWSEALIELKGAEQQLKKTSANVLSQIMNRGALMLLPAMSQAFDAAARSEAITRSAIVAIAVHRHHQRHGEFPEGVDRIDADLLPRDSGALESFTTDPFSGRLLNLKISAEEVLVYSVGTDLVDGGGEISFDSGMAADFGVRLRLVVPSEGAVE